MQRSYSDRIPGTSDRERLFRKCFGCLASRVAGTRHADVAILFLLHKIPMPRETYEQLTPVTILLRQTHGYGDTNKEVPMLG